MNSMIKSGLGAIAMLLVAQGALADGRWHDRHHRDRGPEYARVVHVEPLVQRYRQDYPERRCWREVRYEDAYVPARPDPTGAAIAGGVAGAILGSQFGSGDGRAVATVAGAAVGAAIGHQAARNGPAGYYVEPRGREVERCRTVRDSRYEERVVAYRVTYQWRGHREVVRMPYHPGKRLRVGVDVYPLR